MSARGLLSMSVCASAALAFSLSAAETGSRLSRERPVRIHNARGRYRLIRPEAFPGDPAPSLIDEEPELFRQRLTASRIDSIVETYLSRMLETYAGKYRFPDGFRTFLEKEETAREVFISALDYRYDDIRKAAGVFDELRSHDEKLLIKYIHLATALAVVYDTPDAVLTSRNYSLWGLEEQQYAELPQYKAVWDYYTSSSNARNFSFSMHQLPWPVLVHLVDNDVTVQEQQWVRAKYRSRTEVGALYQGVPYDYDKLNQRAAKLGTRPYVLPNILTYGGVCGDQAQFTTRVAKCLGVPAMKVRGESRYGGIGHVWAGFLVIQAGRPRLEFTGRYFYDYYYTGDVFDPQTRTETLDRYIAMMYDGAAASFEKYTRSLLLTRLAEAMEQSHPEKSLELVQHALRMNYFNMWGWPLLMRHVKSGTMKARDGLKWFNDCLRVLKNHPDMTFECLQTFKECVPKNDIKKRQSLYTQAFQVYKQRPDLQLKLRMSQAQELVGAGMKIEALNVLASTVVSNAKEGSLVLPAMKMAAEISREFGLQNQAYAVLRKAEAAFPKERGTRVSEAYTEFQEILESLRR